MISLVTNTRGETAMLKPSTTDYSAMSGPELAIAYNAMARSEAGKKQGAKETKKFKDLKTGVARCLALASTISTGGGIPAEKTKVQKKQKGGDAIVAEFGFRAGSSREKLLLSLYANLGKQVSIEVLARTVFGSSSSERVRELMAVSKGLPWRIKEDGLKYRLNREKKDGAVSLGLHAAK